MAFESQASRLNVRKGESLLPFLTQQGRTPVFQQSPLLCLVVQLYHHVSCVSGLQVSYTQPSLSIIFAQWMHRHWKRYQALPVHFWTLQADFGVCMK